MLLYRIAVAIFTFTVGCLAADQDVLTILKQQNGISTFVGLLEQFQDLIDILNNGPFSGRPKLKNGQKDEADRAPVLVPTDSALSAFVATEPDITSDAEAVKALMQYHIANGTHPSATFGLQPLFVPTLLNNPNYTNVTGGQVIEITSQDNKPTIVTGVKAASHVVEAVCCTSF